MDEWEDKMFCFIGKIKISKMHVYIRHCAKQMDKWDSISKKFKKIFCVRQNGTYNISTNSWLVN